MSRLGRSLMFRMSSRRPLVSGAAQTTLTAADTVTLSDSLARGVTPALADTITVSDAIAPIRPLPQFHVIDSSTVAGTNVTPVVLTVESVIPVGAWIFVAAGSTSQPFTVADTQGNTYARERVETAGSGTCSVSQFHCQVTTQLNPGDTISATPGASVGGKVAMAIWSNEIYGVDATSFAVGFDATGASTSVSLTMGAAMAEPQGVLVQSLVVGGAGAAQQPASATMQTQSLVSSTGTVRVLGMFTQMLPTQTTPSTTVSWASAENYATIAQVYAANVGAKPQILTDGVRLVDALAIRAAPVIADTVTISESLAAVKSGGGAFAQSLADTVTISDALPVTVGRFLADSVAIADVLAPRATRPIADSVTVIDSLLRVAKPRLADSVAVSESLLRVAKPALTDSVAVAESLLRVARPALADSVAVAESLLRTARPALADSVAVTDTLVKKATKPLADTATVSESLGVVKGPSRALADTLTVADSLVKAAVHQLADSATITDSLARVRVVPRPLADTAAITDSLARTAVRPLADTITLTDALPVRVTRPLADSVAVTDALIKAATHGLSDSVAVAESLLRRPTRPLTDTVALSDALVRRPAPALADSVTVADTLSSTGGYIGRKSATWGGGYCNIIVPHPAHSGMAFAGGDQWGLLFTSDYGASWHPGMLGVTIQTGGAVNGLVLSRAASWSLKDPTTTYLGYGGQNGGLGGGSFARLQGGTWTKAVSDTNYGFATVGGTQASRPRGGVGRLIQVDLDVSSGTEYVYALMTKNTGSGAVFSRSTDSGDTFTDLFAATTGTGAAEVHNGSWKALALVDTNADGIPDTALLASYRDVSLDGTTPGGSHLWQITAGTASIRAATGTAQVTATQITPPAGVVDDLVTVGSTVYAACGPYGLWKTTNGGTTWTQVSASQFTSNWVSSVDAIGSVILVGCTRDATSGHNVAISTNSGTSWSWLTSPTVTHGTGGNINTVPWGETNELWLMASGAPSFTNYLGGSTYDCECARLDPTDASLNTIYVSGSAGAWVSRDQGATWRPAVVGLNGGELNHVAPGLNGAVTMDDTDYNGASSTDYLRTATRLSGTLTFPAASLTDKTDDSGNTYHLVTTTGAPDIQRNGTSIASQEVKNGMISLTDFQVSNEGVVYLAQNGGGVWVLEPVVIRTSRVLADSFTLADSLTTTSAGHKSGSLADSVTLADSLQRAMKPVIADTIAVAESLVRAVRPKLADAVAVTDTLAKLATKPLADSVGVTDSLVKRPVPRLSDQATISDTLAVRATRPLADAVAVTDVIEPRIGRPIADTVTVSESLATATTGHKAVSLADTVAASDSLALRATRQLSDTATVTDVLARRVARPLADSVAISDSLVRKPTRALADAVVVTDSILRRVAASLADSVSVIDSLVTFATRPRTLADTVGATDNLARRPAPRLADAFAVGDVLDLSRVVRGLADSVSVLDALPVRVARRAADTVTVVDQLGAIRMPKLADSISLADALKAPQFLHDVVTATDFLHITATFLDLQANMVSRAFAAVNFAPSEIPTVSFNSLLRRFARSATSEGAVGFDDAEIRSAKGTLTEDGSRV